MPVDKPVSYSSLGRLEHVNWDESDVPVDKQTSYGTVAEIEFERKDIIDKFSTYESLKHLETSQTVERGKTYTTTHQIIDTRGQERFQMYLTLSNVENHIQYEYLQTYSTVHYVNSVSPRDVFVAVSYTHLRAHET